MQPSDGLALAGIVAAIFATFLTYRTGKEARESAERQAARTIEATSAEARATRLFERRKDVYEQVLDYAYRIDQSIDRIAPIVTWDGMPTPPTFPSEDEMRRQNARTSAWGSRELRDKLAELKEAVQEFQSAVNLYYRFIEEYGEQSEESREQWPVADANRWVVKALVKEVVEQANADLAR